MTDRRCRCCDGDGYITVTCDRCNGSGEGRTETQTCLKCRGKGTLKYECDCADVFHHDQTDESEE